MGRVFVSTMLPMAALGMIIALGGGIAPEINIPAGLLTAYLVITALATVRPALGASRGLAIGGLLVASAVAAVMIAFAAQAFANGGTRNGMPAFPFVMFGVVGLLGSIGDVRVLRSGALRGPARLARHLWRMSFALFLASLSASVQFIKMIPREYRFPGMIALPMLVVLVTMFYWLWRVRSRKGGRGIVIAPAPLEVA